MIKILTMAAVFATQVPMAGPCNLTGELTKHMQIHIYTEKDWAKIPNQFAKENRPFAQWNNQKCIIHMKPEMFGNICHEIDHCIRGDYHD